MQPLKRMAVEILVSREEILAAVTVLMMAALTKCREMWNRVGTAPPHGT